MIGVLELVHHHIAIAAAEHLVESGRVLEPRRQLEDEVLEVRHAIARVALVQGRVDRGRLGVKFGLLVLCVAPVRAPSLGPRGDPLGRHALLLCAPDEGQ